MKLAYCVLLLCYSQLCSACPAITFQVGPFFSTTFIAKYWQNFALSIEDELGCTVNIQASSSYEHFLDILAKPQGDIFITPTHYVYALQSKNLTAILKSENTAQIYLLSRHDISKDGASVLRGDIILVPSPYTQAYLELLEWLTDNGLKNKVSFDFNHSHDSATLLMLKGKYSSAVVLGNVYERFPDFIKAKYPAIKLPAKGGASILTKSDASPDLNQAIINSKDKLNLLKWAKAPPSSPSDAFSQVFANQLERYLEGQPNN